MIRMNLRKLLSERNMTQAELAERTGIRPSTICDICNNTCSFLKVKNIEKICTALGCQVCELIILL